MDEQGPMNETGLSVCSLTNFNFGVGSISSWVSSKTIDQIGPVWQRAGTNLLIEKAASGRPAAC